MEESEGKLLPGLTWRSFLFLIYAATLLAPLDAFVELSTGLRFLAIGPGYLVAPPALYVGIILFTEISRMFGKPLTKNEVYIMYFLFPSAITEVFFLDLIRQAYLKGSLISMSFKDPLTKQPLPLMLPVWYAPPLGSQAYELRSFLHPDWIMPILVFLVAHGTYVLSEMGLGLLCAHLFIEVEKLPYPIAPVDAAGIVTIAEREPTRVKVFSLSTALSMVWSAITFGVPTTMGHAFGIRAGFLTFADLTTTIDIILPGAVLGFIFEPFPYFMGWMLSSSTIISMLIGSFAIWVVGNSFALKIRSPLFADFQADYRIGMSADLVMWRATLDIWMSFFMGAALSVALVRFVLGRGYLIRSLKSLARLAEAKETGYLPLGLTLALWLGGTIFIVVMLHFLCPNFSILILILFSAVIPFLNAMINARGMGEVGFGISIPNLKEFAILSAGYMGSDIWFSPLYIRGMGQGNVAASNVYRVKVAKMLDTKPLDYFKGLVIIVPITYAISFLIVSLFWAMAPIPSYAFPATVSLWPELVVEQCFYMTKFFKLFKPILFFSGLVIIGAITLTCSFLSIPYISPIALVAGLSTPPYSSIALAIGYVIGNRVLKRIFGAEWWERYKSVILAGVSCGYGLIASIAGVTILLSKALWYTYTSY